MCVKLYKLCTTSTLSIIQLFNTLKRVITKRCHISKYALFIKRVLLQKEVKPIFSVNLAYTYISNNLNLKCAICTCRDILMASFFSLVYKYECPHSSHNRRPVPSTDKAIPSCFYFRISWILMEQRCFFNTIITLILMTWKCPYHFSNLNSKIVMVYFVL